MYNQSFTHGNAYTKTHIHAYWYGCIKDKFFKGVISQNFMRVFET